MIKLEVVVILFFRAHKVTTSLRIMEMLLSSKDLPNALKLYGTAASKHWQKKEPITEYAHWIMSPSQPSLLIKPDISTKKTN